MTPRKGGIGRKVGKKKSCCQKVVSDRSLTARKREDAIIQKDLQEKRKREDAIMQKDLQEKLTSRRESRRERTNLSATCSFEYDEVPRSDDLQDDSLKELKAEKEEYLKARQQAIIAEKKVDKLKHQLKKEKEAVVSLQNERDLIVNESNIKLEDIKRKIYNQDKSSKIEIDFIKSQRIGKLQETEKIMKVIFCKYRMTHPKK